MTRKNITTKEAANEWLMSHFPKFEVVKWGGSGQSTDTTILDKERNVEFSYSFMRFKDKIQKNPNREFGLSNEEARAKARKVMTEKYGVRSPLQVKEFNDKAKKTTLKRYGTENVMHNESFIEELKKKMQKEVWGNEEVKNRIVQNRKRTNAERYGSESPLQRADIQKKIIETSKREYGFDRPSQHPDVIKKNLDTKIKTGIVKTYSGKTMQEWAKERGVSYTWFQQNCKEKGFEEAIKLTKEYTNIEFCVKEFLDKNNIDYSYDKILSGCKLRPDFVIESHKLIIECDGLYWHSDKYLTDKNYHKRKLETYESLGYRALFFRSDEIEKSFEIVKSIILNSLKMNTKKIFARKCELKLLEKEGVDFISQNHLMGSGKGRIYGLISYGEIVAALQVKCTSVDTGSYEISRFCTKNNVSVPGGFSRLLKFAKNNESPNFISTFIDRRYGSGNYLSELGFKKSNSHISFKWTNGEETFGRMTFPGNSGTDKGLARIFDAGQQKYILEI